jgi:hypothetical protein
MSRAPAGLNVVIRLGASDGCAAFLGSLEPYSLVLQTKIGHLSPFFIGQQRDDNSLTSA